MTESELRAEVEALRRRLAILDAGGGPGLRAAPDSDVFRRLFEQNPQPMWVFDVDTLAILEVNEAAIQQYGFSRSEFLDLTILELREPESIPLVRDALRVPGGPYHQPGVFRHRRKDGSLIDVAVTAHELEFDGHKARLVLASDVTGQIRAEARLLRLNRILAMRGQINNALIRAHDRQSLFEVACRSAVREGGFSGAWVVSFDRDRGQPEVLAASGSSIELSGVLCAADGVAADGSERLIDAIRQGIRHVDHETMLAGSELPGESRGAPSVHSLAAYPLTIAGQPAGSLVLCVNDPQFFELQVMSLLEELAADLSHAVDHVEDRERRRKLETNLLETEARYRALFDCPLIGIYLSDLDTRIIDVNPAACEMVGFDLDELKAWTLETLVATPDDQLLAAHAIREILECGELKNPVTLRLRCKNGEVIWVETVANLVRENGEAVAIEGTLRNITERRQLIASLRESERRFRETLENVHLVGIGLDVTGKISFCNDYLLQLTGREGEDVIGRDWFDLFIPPEIDREIRSMFAETIRGGTFPVHHENPIVTRTGERLQIAWNNTVLKDVEGSIIGEVSLGEDVTRQRAVEEELRKSANLMRRVFASLGEAVLIIDPPTHRILQCNHAVERVFGYTSDELTGQEAGMLFVDDSDYAEYGARCEETLEIGRISHIEFRQRRKDGSIIETETTVSVIDDEAGWQAGMVCVVRDITERRKAQRLLEEGEQEQRRLVGQLQLERERLIQAQSVGKIGSWEEDPASGRIWASAETFRILGLPQAESEIDRNRVAACFPDRARFDGFMASLRADGRLQELELRVDPADGGESRVVRLTGERRRGSEGQPAKVAGVVHDVTSRRRAAKEIENAQRRIALHEENSPLAVVEFGRDLRILHWSGNAERLFGWTAADVLRKAPPEWTFIHPEEHEVVNRVMNDLFEGRTAHQISFNRNLAKDGRVLFCEWYHSVIHTSDGEGSTILSLVHDVTKRKDAEKSLIRSQAQLRALTSRLENMREKERTRISREIHDELGQMLTGIKMDLRWMEQFLDPLNGDHRLNPMLDRLIETSELTDATIGTVQRIAADLRPGILDKLGLGNTLVYEAARFEERSGIVCTVDLPEEDPSTDPEIATSCFRIFQEALTNVARHADATRIEVGLRSEGDWTILTISDNGRGISGAELVDPASLGLLGMQERARLLGGEVHFASDPGSGTRVTVRIPRRPNPLEES